MSNLTIYSFYIRKGFLEEWDKFSKIVEKVEKENYLRRKEKVKMERRTSKNYKYVKKDFRVVALERLIRGYNLKHSDVKISNIKVKEIKKEKKKDDFIRSIIDGMVPSN